MIEKVEMYSAVCDNCGVVCGEGVVAWNDKGYTKEVAVDSNWAVADDKCYCPKCYSYDDEDNLVITKLSVRGNVLVDADEANEFKTSHDKALHKHFVLKWVAIYDELPEENQEVLIYFAHTNNTPNEFDKRFIKKAIFKNGSFSNNEHITHWAIPLTPCLERSAYVFGVSSDFAMKNWTKK